MSETFPYPDAVRNICADIRDDLVSHLVTLIESVRQYTAAYAVYSVVYKLQVSCSELCAQGLQYETACAFAERFFGPDALRWVEDDLWHPYADQEHQRDG